MKRFGKEGGLSKRSRFEIDQHHREDLISFVDDRMIEAIGVDLLRTVEIFGQNTAVTKMSRNGSETIKVFRPDAEARTAGYVPLMWIEFGGNHLQDGCFLEVWPEEERLIEAVETQEGKRPQPLPVKNTRALTVRALNIVREGVLEEPYHRTAA